MRFVSHYFESMAGIEIYPILSFLIFFLFFLVVTYKVIKMDKNEVNELSHLPLDGDNSESNSDQNL